MVELCKRLIDLFMQIQGSKWKILAERSLSFFVTFATSLAHRSREREKNTRSNFVSTLPNVFC